MGSGESFTLGIFCAMGLFVAGIGLLNCGYSSGYCKAQRDFLEAPVVFADYSVDTFKTCSSLHVDSQVNEIMSKGSFTRGCSK